MVSKVRFVNKFSLSTFAKIPDNNKYIIRLGSLIQVMKSEMPPNQKSIDTFEIKDIFCKGIIHEGIITSCQKWNKVEAINIP